ncbi:MAG: 16S rRNA (guanine(966)-N(2))-methyltransferase RsmD [Ignavibacteria bacterium]|nr:16S rRNA (guanine(966)-N(2))-methyltransferase RsmD [Ignavibacteria bacterium]
MRIIAGKYKGRFIKFPKSNLVRPTTDKTKESIFNYLYHSFEFEGIKVCDLYAGSGSLGLEALSRGAESVHFIEKDYKVSQILKENIYSLKAQAECEVFKMDALRFVKKKKHSTYDLILADPPFFKNDIHEVVENILTKDFLVEGGILIIERSAQTKDVDTAAFKCDPFKRLGDSLIYKFDA